MTAETVGRRARAGSLFTGTGALDLAAAEVLDCGLAWVCEYEPPTEKTPRPEQGGARLLAHHYPDVPNLGDITAVDWDTVAPMDILTGGFPCTDLSLAGAQAGLRPETRSGLWAHMAHAVSRLRPSLVLIENVRGLASAEAHSDMELCPWCVGDGQGEPVLRAFGAVLGDLANLGYDAVWCGLPASSIGAPHERFRFFVAATRNTTMRRRDVPSFEGQCGKPARSAGGSSVVAADSYGPRREGAKPAGGRDLSACGVAAHPEGDRRNERGAKPAGQLGGPDVAERGAPTSDAEGKRRRVGNPVDVGPACGESDALGDPDQHATDWGIYGPAIRRWETILERPAPIPTVTGARGGRVLNPALPEWMMGLPEGWITGVPGLSRNAQLKLAGNGVVKQQAVAALRHLLPLLASVECAA